MLRKNQQDKEKKYQKMKKTFLFVSYNQYFMYSMILCQKGAFQTLMLMDIAVCRTVNTNSPKRRKIQRIQEFAFMLKVVLELLHDWL